MKAKVKIKSAPEGAKFNEEVEYFVFGNTNDSTFVFDEEGEAYFLSNLEWERVQ